MTFPEGSKSNAEMLVGKPVNIFRRLFAIKSQMQTEASEPPVAKSNNLIQKKIAALTLDERQLHLWDKQFRSVLAPS